MVLTELCMVMGGAVRRRESKGWSLSLGCLLLKSRVVLSLGCLLLKSRVNDSRPNTHLYSYYVGSLR